MLWDLGPFEVVGQESAEEQLERGDFKFILHGRKLHGNFGLVRMKSAEKGNEWLLLKKKDEHATPGWDVDRFAVSVKTGRTQQEIALDLPPKQAAAAGETPMPSSIEPMLASLADQPPTGADWIYEVKWDGVRALCFIENGSIRSVGRKGTSIDKQYPELAKIPKCLQANSAILDGEVAAVDENGRPSFGRLQPRIMASGASAIAQLARTRPVTFFAFDLLYLNGRDLRKLPLSERRALLENVVTPDGAAIVVSEQFRVDPNQFLEAARAQGLEGIVAKRLSCPYSSGRSRDWIKVKATREQEFVIAGYTHGERDYFGALLLGVYDNGALVFAGNVGTGFDRKLMKMIHDRLQPLRTGRPPFSVIPSLPQKIEWVKPQIVCTVRFLEWTHEDRLRAPVFVGLRDDIEPKECQRTGAFIAPAEAPVRTPLLPADKDAATLTIDGHSFTIKNLSKVFYPDDGYTKRDVLEYYNAVAPLLIPHLRDRPLSLRRYPDGIAKEGFFQKNAEDLPEWMRRETILAEDGEPRVQVIVRDRGDLIYLANLGCIDQNPWMSRVATLDHPDYILIDLDPHQCSFDKIIEAGLLVHSMLEAIGFAGYPKTTGGDGLHIYIPIEPVYTYEQARSFAEILARLAIRKRPDLFTAPRSVGRREKNRVYFDWMQIARGKTISAPYVLRAHPHAPVATPLEWNELKPGLRPAQFHIRNAMERFDRVGDLFAPVLEKPQRLEHALDRMHVLTA
jgi:bifunctional non-homologous end joining protein LigD